MTYISEFSIYQHVLAHHSERKARCRRLKLSSEILANPSFDIRIAVGGVSEHRYHVSGSEMFCNDISILLFLAAYNIRARQAGEHRSFLPPLLLFPSSHATRAFT
jgi:hypothetical protein